MVHCGIDGMRVLSCRRREEGEGGRERGRGREREEKNESECYKPSDRILIYSNQACTMRNKSLRDYVNPVTNNHFHYQPHPQVHAVPTSPTSQVHACV